MKKKLISVLLCAAMVGTMFAGCGNKESKDGGSGEGGSSDKIALDIIISQYGNFTKDWWTEFEKTFEEANKDIDLNIEIVSWNDIYSVVNTRISSNEQPDILNISGFADYVADDLLMPAEEYVSDELKNNFVPSFWESNEMDGTVWALPILASCRSLFCNVDLLKEAGIENPPTTWDEVLTACKAVKDKFGKDIVPWGLDISTDEGQAAFSYYTWNFGGGYVDDKGEWALNSKENVEAVEYIKSLIDGGYCNSAPFTDTRYPLQDAFSAGTLAMMIGPMNMVAADSKVNYVAADLPGEKTALGVCDQLMVFKDEKADDARTAAITKFFDAFYECETYSNYMVYEGFLPATQDASENLAANAEKYTVGGSDATGSSEYFKTFCAVLPNCKFYPMQKAEWMDVRNGVIDVEQKVCEGTIGAQEALDKLQESVAK
ncbi:MAG: extracellular solute-binding protein [Dorea sp.]|jgi:multiple sugar transport system substrate-binding protein|nr:extracellular solute-binding protein [Dorea sp.]